MKPKERMRRALQFEAVDRLPTQINYTKSMGDRMTVHFGIDRAELPSFLDNHMVRVDLSHQDRISEDGKFRFDWWGVGWDTAEEGYFAAVNPLGVQADLDSYPWPNPDEDSLLSDAVTVIDADQAEHFITPNFGFVLFERAWALRGFETFLMDLAVNLDYAEALLDRITEIQLTLIHRYLDLGVDGGYFGDDYGAQKNMLFAPATWRSLIKPRLARLFAPFVEAGLSVLMHSDGQIAPILADLVEIGLTALNPVQPEVIDHHWVKAEFGNRLAYYGGVSTQTVLPHGSPAEVKQAVRGCAASLAPDGTGLVVAPSHRMMVDVPMDNVDALLEGFRELG